MRFSALVLTVLLFVTLLPAENWPAWRGPTHNSLSTETGLPVKWGPDENIGKQWLPPEAYRRSLS